MKIQLTELLLLLSVFLCILFRFYFRHNPFQYSLCLAHGEVSHVVVLWRNIDQPEKQ